MNRIPITRKGYEALRKELEHLKAVERPKNILAIEEARAHGDITENAEFEAAKERKAFIDGKLYELESKLSNVDIIETDSLPKDRAMFGCTIVIENVDTGESLQYQLVGPDESNVEEGRISVTSPLGKLVIGKKRGDEIILQAPGGKRAYELVEIH